MSETPDYTPPVKPPLSADQKAQLGNILKNLTTDIGQWNQDIADDHGIAKPEHITDFQERMTLLFQSIEAYDIDDSNLEEQLKYVETQITLNAVRLELTEAEYQLAIKVIQDTDPFGDTAASIQAFKEALDRFPEYKEGIAKAHGQKIIPLITNGDFSLQDYYEKAYEAGYVISRRGQHFEIETRTTTTFADHQAITELYTPYLNSKDLQQNRNVDQVAEKALDNEAWQDFKSPRWQEQLATPERAFAMPERFPNAVFTRNKPEPGMLNNELSHLAFYQAFYKPMGNTREVDVTDLTKKIGFENITTVHQIDEFLSDMANLMTDPYRVVSLANLSFIDIKNSGYGPNIDFAIDEINNLFEKRGDDTRVEDFQTYQELTSYIRNNSLDEPEAETIRNNALAAGTKLLDIMPTIVRRAQKTDSPPHQP